MSELSEISFVDGAGENINELMVKEGLVSVRSVQGSKDPVLQQLNELQEAAKAAKKGKWSDDGEVSMICKPFCTQMNTISTSKYPEVTFI